MIKKKLYTDCKIILQVSPCFISNFQHFSKDKLLSDRVNPFTPKISLVIPFNPLSPVGDQVRISPYYIYTISCRQVMRIKKNANYGIILIDPIPN